MTTTGLAESGSGPFILEEARPNKSRLERTVAGLTRVRAFDGTTGWVLEAGEEIPRPIDADERRQMAENEFDSDLLDFEARGITIALAGMEKLGAGRAYKLKVTSRHGAVHFSYVDDSSFLEVRRDYVNPDGSTTKQVFGGRKTVDGVVRPMTYETGQDGDPRRLLVQAQKVEINPVIPDSRFRVPVLP